MGFLATFAAIIMRYSRFFSASAALAAGLLAASAQSTDSIHTTLGELSVTAIKQAPSLSLQPVASTTISPAMVDRFHIVTMKGASEIAPNFFIPDYGSRITSSIYVRGLGARIDQPAVGLNVDNIPVLNKNDYDFDLTDIERIEVLRGPQSVLYGRNTMGGLINVYTLSPMRYQGVRLLGEYSTGRSWRASAGIYHKLRSDLGMALTVSATGTDGFYTNEYNSTPADRGHQGAVRWKTVYQPSQSRFSLENIVSVNVNRESGYPYASLTTGQIAYNDTCFYRRTSLSEGLTMQWRLDGVTVSSITGLRYMDDNLTLDQDFTPDSYFTLTQATREWTLSQDLIFKGATGRYSWMAGAFGFFKHARMRAPVTFLPDGIDRLILGNINSHLPATMPVSFSWGEDRFDLNSEFVTPVWGAALYHRSDYTAGRWQLSAALRLDYEHSAMRCHSHTATSTVAAMGPFGLTRPLEIDNSHRLSQHFLQLLPKVTATYRLPMPSPSSVYASVARGYKAGGYNTQIFSDVLQQQLAGAMIESWSNMIPAHVLPGISAMFSSDLDVNSIVSYKPEHSWNYEVGAHIACADGRVHTDLSVFYIDCRDQQLTMFPPGNGTGRMMANAARTRSWGVEAGVNASPHPRLDLRATYGYTDARFVSFSDARGDYSGNFIPYAPRHTLFGSVTYRQPLPMRWLEQLSVSVDGRGVGSIYWDEANQHRQPLYGLMGASVALGGPHYSLEFWGENILNRHFDTFYFVSIGHSFVQRGKPRRLGVTLRIDI